MALERVEFFVGSTSTLSLRNLKRVDTKPTTQITDASVTARMLDAAGAAVTGVSDPVTLSAVSGFDGFYQGTIPETASVSVGDTGQFVITAVSVSAGTRVFYVDYKVVEG